MALMHIPLEQIDQTQLQSLVLDSKAAEALTIEYKRDTYGSNDAARAEFLADISSFANTRGGDLLVGIEAPAGVPAAFVPFPGDADAERLRFEQMARSGLETAHPQFSDQSRSDRVRWLRSGHTTTAQLQRAASRDFSG